MMPELTPDIPLKKEKKRKKKIRILEQSLRPARTEKSKDKVFIPLSV